MQRWKTRGLAMERSFSCSISASTSCTSLPTRETRGGSSGRGRMTPTWKVHTIIPRCFPGSQLPSSNDTSLLPHSLPSPSGASAACQSRWYRWNKMFYKTAVKFKSSTTGRLAYIPAWGASSASLQEAVKTMSALTCTQIAQRTAQQSETDALACEACLQTMNSPTSMLWRRHHPFTTPENVAFHLMGKRTVSKPTIFNASQLCVHPLFMTTITLSASAWLLCQICSWPVLVNGSLATFCSLSGFYDEPS